MSLPIPNRTSVPVVVEAATYDGTGSAANLGVMCNRVFVSVLSGIALVGLDGTSTSKFVKLPSGSVFNWPVATSKVWVKGSGGDTEVCIVGGAMES